MITATSITLVIDVPAAAAADIASRCPDAPIFERFSYTGGPMHVTPDEAREIEAEADYYCDKDGPGQSLTVGQRRSYQLLRDRARSALSTLEAAS